QTVHILTMLEELHADQQVEQRVQVRGFGSIDWYSATGPLGSRGEQLQRFKVSEGQVVFEKHLQTLAAPVLWPIHNRFEDKQHGTAVRGVTLDPLVKEAFLSLPDLLGFGTIRDLQEECECVLAGA